MRDVVALDFGSLKELRRSHNRNQYHLDVIAIRALLS